MSTKRQTLYYGGDIVTVTGEGDTAEALIEENGSITYVGTLAGAQELLREDAHKVNLKGQCLIPAFIDGHSHVLKTAQFVDYADLSECTCFEDIIKVLTEYVNETGAGQEGGPALVMGKSYDHNFLEEQKHPDKYLLDQVSATIPIYIFHTSMHVGVANSAMLRLAEIGSETPDPAGGRFGRVVGTGKSETEKSETHGEYGEPDGYVEETGAMTKILLAAYPYMDMDLDRQLAAAQQEYLKYGVTTVQEGAMGCDDMQMLAAAGEKGILKLDVVTYLMADQEPDRIWAEYGEMAGRYHNHVKLGGTKIVLDGSPQGKTAWLSKPYEGEDTYAGYPAQTAENVEKWVAYAVKNGLQILAHCNGDAAGDQFLDAWEKVCRENKRRDGVSEERESTDRDLRPVMIHCQTVRDDQLDRMAKVGMIPSVFVGHTWFWGDVHLHNLGQGRGKRISPCRSAFERGLKVNFHQDTPVTNPDMLFSMWCSVNRKTRTGQEIGTDQGITPYEALKAVTINPAYAYFEEDSKGTLETGKRADLVILDRNPLTVPTEEIKDIKVLVTIKDGERLYER